MPQDVVALGPAPARERNHDFSLLDCVTFNDHYGAAHSRL